MANPLPLEHIQNAPFVSGTPGMEDESKHPNASFILSLQPPGTQSYTPHLVAKSMVTMQATMTFHQWYIPRQQTIHWKPNNSIVMPPIFLLTLHITQEALHQTMQQSWMGATLSNMIIWWWIGSCQQTQHQQTMPPPVHRTTTIAHQSWCAISQHMQNGWYDSILPSLQWWQQHDNDHDNHNCSSRLHPKLHHPWKWQACNDTCANYTQPHDPPKSANNQPTPSQGFPPCKLTLPHYATILVKITTTQA